MQGTSSALCISFGLHMEVVRVCAHQPQSTGRVFAQCNTVVNNVIMEESVNICCCSSFPTEWGALLQSDGLGHGVYDVAAVLIW